MRKLFAIIAFLAAALIIYKAEPELDFDNESLPPPKEINFWGIYDLPEVYQPVISEFKKTYPDIGISYKQFADTEEYHQLLMKQLEKGKGPDIFFFRSQDQASYDKYLAPADLDYAEKFAPIAKNSLRKNNLLYALPFWVDSLMLYYNKAYYPEGIRKNWYEFAEQTRGLNTGGIAMGRLDNIKSGWDILQALFLQKGIRLSGKPENSLYDTLEFFNRFAYPIDKYYNWNEKLNKDYEDEEIDSFVRGKVAAIAGYSSLNNYLKVKINQLKTYQSRYKMKAEDIGIALFPQFNTDEPKYLAKHMNIAVSIYSDYPQEAWEFIKLITGETQAAYYQQTTGRTPGRILPPAAAETELARIQREQVAHSYSYNLSEEAKAKIEPIVNRAVKDKRVLKEILNLEF